MSSKILYKDNTKLHKGNTCVFVHFNPHHFVYRYVFYYLNKIKEVGFNILFVSTSRLQEADIESLKTSCSMVLVRKNQGLDFASWKEGLSKINYGKDNDEILITNDSVIGPFFSLKDICEKMRVTNLDMWGMTDSQQIDYHIQSYFVCFRKPILQSNLFKDFWSKVKILKDKDAIIQNYEIGLTQNFLQHGLNCSAYNHIHIINDKKLSLPDINPLAFYWDSLITNYGYPFVKRDMFHKPELQEFNVRYKFERILEEVNTPYPALLIYNYLNVYDSMTNNKNILHKQLNELQHLNHVEKEYERIKKDYAFLEEMYINTMQERDNIRNVLHHITHSRIWKLTNKLSRFFKFLKIEK